MTEDHRFRTFVMIGELAGCGCALVIIVCIVALAASVIGGAP